MIAILPIPFQDTGEVDELGFRRVVDAPIGEGVNGVAICGLASEYAKLNDKEKAGIQPLAVRRSPSKGGN